ncbi:MAG: molybdopterin-synthase adenylyltransferase MoeB [Candidatus Margulisbacteria bacterium]|nr:molybdopterin-synthase adenylyltransferase MoeB [Candidatus Margulisiibacteriota bacterium]
MQRYSRQIILPEIGEKGQEKLLNAKVLVVGLGGLGSPVAVYLAGAGVGTLGLLDSDAVELSNLNRQVIFSTEDIGKKKAAAAAQRLKRLNPDIKINEYVLRLGQDNIRGIISDYDIVVDCSDNFPTRYLANDACVLAKKPLVHGAIYQFEGQVTVIKPGQGPCYRCLFAEPPPPGSIPSCQEAGALGAIAGIIGMIQATEAIKLILGVGQPLIGKLLVFNALEMSFRKVDIPQNKKCSVCA